MKNLVRIYKALSDPNRVRIVKMLEQRSLCVCEITSILKLATSTVSKHLAILRDAGLIDEYKHGKWVNFCLNAEENSPYAPPILSQLSGWINDDEVIKKDIQKVKTVDRNQICGID